jgi:hypothetical protein
MKGSEDVCLKDVGVKIVDGVCSVYYSFEYKDTNEGDITTLSHRVKYDPQKGYLMQSEIKPVVVGPLKEKAQDWEDRIIFSWAGNPSSLVGASKLVDALSEIGKDPTGLSFKDGVAILKLREC